MDVIAIGTYSIKIEPISFTDFRTNGFNIINMMIIEKKLSSIFQAENHVISNFIGTMACLFYFNHYMQIMQSSLSRFPDHPNRSKLRGIHLKIKSHKMAMQCDPKALELETAKEILAEVFKVRLSDVDEMIKNRFEAVSYEDTSSKENGLWPQEFWLEEYRS